MEPSQAYSVYWGASFATVITWVFAVAASANDAWMNWSGIVYSEISGGCVEFDDMCERYDAATALQHLATAIIGFALVVVLVAAFSSPPTTGRLGLALGIMLAVFSLCEMIAFSLMADVVAELDKSDTVSSFSSGFNFRIEAGPTLGVAVMAWLFGLAGTITILVLRSRATSDHGGPFRQCMSVGGGITEGGSAGPTVVKHVERRIAEGGSVEPTVGTV